MGRIRGIVGLSLATWACAVYGLGCFFRLDLDQVDCELYSRVGCAAGSGGSSTTGTGGAGTGGGGTGGGGAPPTCVPSESMDPVAEGCGVFVSTGGKDSNVGTQGEPVQTLTHALELALAKGKPVYACAGVTPFSEALSVPAGAVIYGGLDCSSWKYIGGKTKTQITADAGKVPLTLQMGASATEVFDLYVAAAAAKDPGGSSIAVVVDQAVAMFTRCTLVAQDARDGDAGASGGATVMQAEGGVVGGAAGPNGMGSIAGGAGGENVACSLKGGNGGNGGATMNGDGQDGLVGDSGNGGAKGTGETNAVCTNGANGANGMLASFGPAVQGPGILDANGWHGIDGQPGVDGTNGASGGGGGGSKAMVAEHGAGGGGGGAGGCAGKRGEGGKSAGSSIALVSLSAVVTLTECKLTSGKGGRGGDGGGGQKGQLGGSAGIGGAGSLPSSGCDGGKGGKGGNGGNGGGGLGGHSLGIALLGAAPVLDDATKKAIVSGALGVGGNGGNMDVDLNHGAPGNGGACWDFASNKSCL